MLLPVKIVAGLCSPPFPYYTNAVESLNRVAKLHTGHKKQQLPQFVQMMEELYNTQEREVAKALAGSGEYRVISTLKKHQYQARKWLVMLEKQQKLALNRFMSQSVVAEESSTITSSDDLSSNKLTSLFCLNTFLSKYGENQLQLRNLIFVLLQAVAHAGL